MAVILLTTALTAGNGGYSVTIDLTRCSDDRITVDVELPSSLSCSECRYILPRSVPGTYSLDRYGRFIVDAHAYDASGMELTVRRDDGDIVVEGRPARIVYAVNDTWDDPAGAEVFNPTGSNIQCDTNVVLNFHAFVGYVEGAKKSSLPRLRAQTTRVLRSELARTTIEHRHKRCFLRPILHGAGG